MKNNEKQSRKNKQKMPNGFANKSVQFPQLGAP